MWTAERHGRIVPTEQHLQSGPANCHVFFALKNSHRDEGWMTDHHFFLIMRNTKSSHQWQKGDKEGHTHTEGTKHTCTLPCFCIYKLNIYWYGFTSVTSLRLHLVLNRVHWIHATEQVSWSHMACVHEVCWLPYHTAVDPPSPFRLRLFRNTAVEAQPEFTHD